MGIKNTVRSINNASISNFSGFDKDLLIKVYKKQFPDFSESDNLNRNDRIIEHAYSLAAMDNRSYLVQTDVLSAITALNLNPTGTLKKVLEANTEFVKQLNNIKIIKKNHTVGTDTPKVSTSGAGGVQPNATPAQVKKPVTSTGTFSPQVEQAIKSLMGYGELQEIRRRAFEDGPPRGIFMGHNTTGTSNKYYLMFNRADGKVLSFWGGVGKAPSSKLYEPSQKTYYTLMAEKKKKGYQTVVDE